MLRILFTIIYGTLFLIAVGYAQSAARARVTSESPPLSFEVTLARKTERGMDFTKDQIEQMI